jgi:hypothetical protein
MAKIGNESAKRNNRETEKDAPQVYEEGQGRNP